MKLPTKNLRIMFRPLHWIKGRGSHTWVRGNLLNICEAIKDFKYDWIFEILLPRWFEKS